MLTVCGKYQITDIRSRMRRSFLLETIVRSGALLGPEDKETFAALQEELNGSRYF